MGRMDYQYITDWKKENCKCFNVFIRGDENADGVCCRSAVGEHVVQIERLQMPGAVQQIDGGYGVGQIDE